MAKTPLAPGQLEEVTTRTRILNQEQSSPEQSERARPPFWEYIGKLTPEQWKQHVIYIYRGPVRGGKYIAKYMSAITPDMIAERHGGGDYNFILNRGSEMIAREEFGVEGAPIIATSTQPASPSSDLGETGTLAMILQRQNEMFERVLTRISGGDTADLVKNAASSGQEIMRDAFRSAVTTVAVPQQPQQSAEAKMLETMTLFKMMKEIFGPASVVDPIQQTLGIITALKGSGLMGAGKESTLGTIMSALPGVADKIVDGLKYYAQIQNTQAQMQTVGRPQLPAHQPHIVHQMPASPIPQAATPAPQPTPQPSAAPVATEVESGRFPWQDVLEMQVMNILTDLEKPLDGCVSEVMICCDNIDGRLAEMLTANGESGMEAIFSQGPFLPKIPKDARLKEFMRLFILDVAAAKSTPKPVPVQGAPLLVPTPPAADAGNQNPQSS